MSMADHEPPSGFNLPPGCFDVPEPEEPVTCGSCAHWVDGGEDCCGICAARFYRMLDGRGRFLRSIDAAGCIVNMGDERAGECPDYEEYEG